jgi:predicted histone-like DNA-binding protein
VVSGNWRIFALSFKERLVHPAKSTFNIQHSTLKLKIMEVKGTLKYRKVQRTPQTGENAGKKKWYATSVTDREVDFEGFVSHISDHGSPYSRGTIHGVLMDALDHLQELILDGKSVRLSDLGLFSIGMSSKAEDTKEKVTAASVEGVHLIVRNTKSWSNAELRKKCKIQEYGGYIGTDEEGTTGGGTTGGGTEQGGGTTGGGTEQGGGSQDKGDGLE